MRLPVGQRLVQVPAARHDVGEPGPAHEGGMEPVALGNLLGGAAEQDHRVGGLEADAGAKGELDLAGTEFDFERAQRQAEIDQIGAQDLEDWVHLVVALLGQVLIALVEQRHVGRLARLAGVAGAEARPFQLEEMELDFEAGDEVEAAIAQGREGAAQDLARAEWHRPAVGEVDVAQHPAGMRRPGQGAKGRGIGQHDHVGRALQLLHAEATARLPDREHRAVRRILQQHGRGEADAVLQRRIDFRGHQRLAAQDAMLVGEGQAHDRHLAGLHAPLGLAGRDLALLGPEARAFDQAHRLTRPAAVVCLPPRSKPGGGARRHPSSRLPSPRSAPSRRSPPDRGSRQHAVGRAT